MARPKTIKTKAAAAKKAAAEEAKRRKPVTVDEFIADLSAGRRGIPHVKELTQALVERWGGLQEFVDETYNLAHDPATPHPTKVRIMEGIFRMLQYTSETGDGNTQPNEMTSEEITAELQAMLKPILQAAQPAPVVVNG